jgi:hypothetical protein
VSGVSSAPRIAVPRGPAQRPRLRRRIRRALGPAAHDALTHAEFRVFSRGGEDGVLQAILRRTGTESRWFVEFGVGTGQEGNCVLLADVYGWSGLFIEADPTFYGALDAKYADSARVATVNAAVTADNVEALFRQAGVPERIDVLSIDIDGNDFWVWQAIERVAPRMVVIEYNANLPLDSRLVMPRDDGHEWDATDYFGASLGALCELGSRKGCELVHTDRQGVNAFFVRRSLAQGLPGGSEVARHRANYGGRGLEIPRDPRARPFHDLASGTLVDAPRPPRLGAR